VKIAIVVFDGWDELDAIGPYEVFSQAGGVGADIEVSLCDLTGSDQVKGGNGLKIEPEAALSDLNPDLVVVPGGGWTDQSDTGVRAEIKGGDLPKKLQKLHQDGIAVASVCTGGMILARGGLLDGRPAITHYNALSDLQDTNTKLIKARVVDDGDIITAGGVTAGIDLAFHIVEREFGAEVAESVSEIMEYKISDDIYDNSSE
jgi:transcriptional regulator GlxA family with amidase domain